SIVTPRMAMMEKSQTGKRVAIAISAAAVIAAGIFGAVHLRDKPAASHGPVTLLIADLKNHTGDPVFNGTLESTMRLALQGASFINAYDRTRLAELGAGAISGALDDSNAQRIAANQGLNVVVSGALDRQGSDYRLSVRAVQIVTGKVVVSA